MTKEILKYMVVHPAAIVLLPRSFLLNVGYEVKGTLENCTKSKILKFSISNTFPPDGPSERMCQLRCFPSFQPFITSTYICKFIDSSKLQTCCSSEIHSLPFGLDYFMFCGTQDSFGNRAKCWWWFWFSDTCSQENFVETVFLSDNPHGQSMSCKILHFSFMKSMWKGFINSKEKAQL